jgi:hypothetical protein
LWHLRRFPRLEKCVQKRLIAFDQARLARRHAQLAQLRLQVIGAGRLLLEALDELQTPHKPQALSLNVGWTRPTAVLRVEATDPGLMKLSRLTQEPLGA